MKFLDVPQSGSVAGVTSSRNRFGQYRRTRAMPVNPNTPAQTAVRAVLAGCSQNWGGLTLSQRMNWQYWAENHPRVDSLGQQIVLTGAMAFNAVNCLLVGQGLAGVSVPPDDPLPDPPGLTLDTGEAAEIKLAYTPGTLPALTRLLIYSSPPRGAGVTFERDFRFIEAFPPADATPADITISMAQKWGALTDTQCFFWRARLLRTDGGFSPWSATVYANLS